MKFHDREFVNESINLDDNLFTSCTFVECVIVYKGGDFAKLKVNTFKGCTWQFAGAAGQTLNFLRELYHGGGSELVEQTFDNIRNNLHNGS